MTDPSPASFDAAIDRVLTPFAGASRVGTPLRYAGAYREIRQARQEDDATIPQGEWERPLKRADWPLVARLCLQALQSESKDFQIAAWLCEAWVRLHGVPGMAAGVQLLDGLVTHFWPDAYPPYEEDGEARIGILVWLRETLVGALTMHVPLLEFDDLGEPALNLDDWERLIAGKPASPGRARPACPDRAALAAKAAGPRLAGLLALQGDISQARAQWTLFTQRIDAALGSDSLSLSAVADRLCALERAVRSLIDGRAPSPASEGPPAGDGDGSDLSPASDPSRKETKEPAVSSPNAIGSREEAYVVLAQVALYLREHEPHSPTPYLIERALAWGRLPLRDLMDEVLSEEGGLRWYAAMLGLDIHRE